MDNPWAPDHKQIAGALLQAKKYVVDFNYADQLATILGPNSFGPQSGFEKIKWPVNPIWIEWPLPAKIVSIVGQGAKTGSLLVPHPDFDDVIIGITGWQDSENKDANHSYASAIISKKTLLKSGQFKKLLKHRPASKTGEELLQSIGVSISNDLRDELLLKFNWDHSVIDEAYKSAVTEIPFALQILSIISQANYQQETAEDEWILIREPKHEPKKWWDKFMGR